MWQGQRASLPSVIENCEGQEFWLWLQWKFGDWVGPVVLECHREAAHKMSTWKDHHGDDFWNKQRKCEHFHLAVCCSPLCNGQGGLACPICEATETADHGTDTFSLDQLERSVFWLRITCGDYIYKIKMQQKINIIACVSHCWHNLSPLGCPSQDIHSVNLWIPTAARYRFIRN